jgi:hypothetical protein
VRGWQGWWEDIPFDKTINSDLMPMCLAIL